MGGSEERGIVREKKPKRKQIRHPPPDQIVAPAAMAREKARLEVRLQEIRRKKMEDARPPTQSSTSFDQPGPSGLQQQRSNPPSRASSDGEIPDSEPGTPPPKERESRSRTPVARRLGGYVIPRRVRDDSDRTGRRIETGTRREEVPRTDETRRRDEPTRREERDRSRSPVRRQTGDSAVTSLSQREEKERTGHRGAGEHHRRVQAREHAYPERLVINVKQGVPKEPAAEVLALSLHDEDMAAYGISAGPAPSHGAGTEPHDPGSNLVQVRRPEDPDERAGPSKPKTTEQTPHLRWAGPPQTSEESPEKLLHSFTRIVTEKAIHFADQHRDPATGPEWIHLLAHIRVILIHQGPNLARRIANAYYALHDPARVPTEKTQPSGVLAVLPGNAFYKVLQINLDKGPMDFYRDIVRHHEVDRVLRAVRFARNAHAELAENKNQAGPLQILALIGANGMAQNMDRVPPHLLCSKMDRQLKHWKEQSGAGSAFWMGTGIRSVDDDSTAARYVRRLNHHMSVTNLAYPGVGRVPIDQRFTRDNYETAGSGIDRRQWTRETDYEVLYHLSVHIKGKGPDMGCPPVFKLGALQKRVARVRPTSPRTLAAEVSPDPTAPAGVGGYVAAPDGRNIELVEIHSDADDFEEWE